MTETSVERLLPPGPRLPDAVQAFLLMQHRPTVMRRLQKTPPLPTLLTYARNPSGGLR